MTTLFAILVTGLGTYASRAIFIVALARRTIPRPVTRAMEYVGPAVLSALIVTLLLDPDGGLALGVPELAALLCVALLARVTRNHLLSVVAAMAVFWGLQALYGL